MEDKYRILFFRYLYDKLDLKDKEDYLEKMNIEYISNEKWMCEEERVCFKYSKYFYLLNKVNILKLNKSEVEFLKKVNVNSELNDALIKFLEATYKRVLFSDIVNQYIYYGPHSDSYKAKNNEIVLGIKRDEFGFSFGKIKERSIIEEKNRILDEVVNNIEKTSNMNVRIIKYNEIYEKMFHSTM